MAIPTYLESRIYISEILFNSRIEDLYEEIIYETTGLFDFVAGLSLCISVCICRKLLFMYLVGSFPVRLRTKLSLINGSISL